MRVMALLLSSVRLGVGRPIVFAAVLVTFVSLVRFLHFFLIKLDEDDDDVNRRQDANQDLVSKRLCTPKHPGGFTAVEQCYWSESL